ncbi:MAG: hypothetical protein JWN03_4692 [Nocardia sp.]|uniref:hypothetical protein n=1 Tax=Nocardia sp. TaxID=1821 RepID=UPI0026183BD8|nr:hypothetical protein [Nocardia sp.]MCU1644417.1 hypothetical protein [Nocardia sp.]
MTHPPIAQGQIWSAVSPVSGQQSTIVVLDAMPAMLERSRILAARVRPMREVPDGMRLLVVPIDDGLAIAVYDLAAFDRGWFKERVGLLGEPQLEQLKVALSARFDL